MRGQEGLECVDPTGVQLLERAAQSLAPGLPVPEGQSAPARSSDHRDSASSALELYPPLGSYFFGLVKVQAGFPGSQAVRQSLALACKLIAAGFGKEFFFPPQTHGLLDWCINNKC